MILEHALTMFTGVIYISYIDIFESQPNKMLINNSDRAIFLLYCAHVFPYLNAAVNWFLYGITHDLNSSLDNWIEGGLARNLTTQHSSSLMNYRNGAPETTSFTKHLVDNQSEFSWTRKQTIDDGPLYFGPPPTQMLLKSAPSDSSNGFKTANGQCRLSNGTPRKLTRYEEEIESFETM